MKRIISTIMAVMLLTAPVAHANDHEGKEGRKQHRAQMLEKFSPESAALVRSFFEEMRNEHKASKGKHKAKREEMKALLTAERFDSAGFVSHAEALSKVHQAARIEKAEKLAALASKLSHDERVLLADILPKDGKKKGKGKGKRKSSR